MTVVIVVIAKRGKRGKRGIARVGSRRLEERTEGTRSGGARLAGATCRKEHIYRAERSMSPIERIDNVKCDKVT